MRPGSGGLVSRFLGFTVPVMKKLSASDAVWAGQAFVNLPVLVFIFAPVSLLHLLGRPWLARQSVSEADVGWGCCFLLGVALGWLWWSLLVPRWRIWAWSRVADKSELRRLALQHGLIWPQGHAFERTEVRTAATRQKIQELEAIETEEADAST